MKTLKVTAAVGEPGHEPPPEVTVEVRAPRPRLALAAEIPPAQWADAMARLQAQEAESLAEVLADSLPEGTLQRLIGFLIVRTAGARMGVAPLGDPRWQGVRS